MKRIQDQHDKMSFMDYICVTYQVIKIKSKCITLHIHKRSSIRDKLRIAYYSSNNT